jgi:hypothetical protein
MKFPIILLLGILLMGIAGCNPLVQPGQSSQTDLVPLDAQYSIGQTFVARFDGLSGLQIQLSPDQAGDGLVTLRLYSEPGAEQDLGAAVMPLSQVTESRSYRFDFPALNNSNQQYYYAVFEVSGEGRLRVGASTGSTYLDGAFYQQGAPRDGQLAFSLVYDPGYLAVGLAQELIRWAGLLSLAGLIYILPGWTVLSWLWKGWDQLSGAGKVGLATGFSLALAALVMVFTDVIGIHLGKGYSWGLIALGVVGVAWKVLSRGGIRRVWGQIAPVIKRPWISLRGRLPEIALVLLMGMIFVTRWWAVRSLEAPMWGDSVQHTYITQLILDNGGLFESWEPYTPYGSFSNQFGFSAVAALLGWLSGLEATRAVLWAGQVLNGLAILVLYPLAVRLAKGQHWAGVGAVFAAGLLSTMPAFYFNWGRYAQLAGQVILPMALWMLWDVVEEKQLSRQERGMKALPWKKICLAGAALGGMVMYQYRTPFFYLSCILAWVIGWWLPAWRADTRRWLQAGVRVGLVVLVGVLCFLPWGARLLTSNVSDLASSAATSESAWAGVQADYQGWRNVLQYVPPAMMVAALAGWCWGLLRRAWPVFALGWWAAWLASIHAWTVLGVPGAIQVPAFAVMISLYMPAGLLIGWLVGQIAAVKVHWRGIEILLLLALSGLGVWYAWGQRSLPAPQTYAMVTRPDMRAMAWIREQTEPKVRFLVEGFRAFYNTSAVGADAGWWLPLLGERQNSMPPLYALGSEVPLEAGYSAQVVALTAALETTPLSSPEGAALLCEHKITHVYIGQQQGLVGIDWLSQSFAPDELLNQPFYELVYHQDRVYIFAIQAGACDE